MSDFGFNFGIQFGNRGNGFCATPQVNDWMYNNCFRGDFWGRDYCDTGWNRGFDGCFDNGNRWSNRGAWDSIYCDPYYNCAPFNNGCYDTSFCDMACYDSPWGRDCGPNFGLDFMLGGGNCYNSPGLGLYFNW